MTSTVPRDDSRPAAAPWLVFIMTFIPALAVMFNSAPLWVHLLIAAVLLVAMAIIDWMYY